MSLSQLRPELAGCQPAIWQEQITADVNSGQRRHSPAGAMWQAHGWRTMPTTSGAQQYAILQHRQGRFREAEPLPGGAGGGRGDHRRALQPGHPDLYPG